MFGLSLKPEQKKYALYFALIALVISCTGSVLFASDSTMISVTANSTVWRFELLTAYLSTAITFLGYRLLVKDHALGKIALPDDWLGTTIIAASNAWILTVTCQAVFHVLIERLFPNLVAPREVLMVAFALYGGILGFLVALFILGIDDFEVNWLIGISLLDGFLICLVYVTDKQWLDDSVSRLGVNPGSATVFNGTMILLGLFILALARSLLDKLHRLVPDHFPQASFNRISIGLVAIALGIIGVGLFPTQGVRWSDLLPENQLHQICALLVAITSIGGMLFLRNYAPGSYPRLFIILSWGLGVICLVMIASHYLFDVPTFVFTELILFLIFFVWLIFFRLVTEHIIINQNSR